MTRTKAELLKAAAETEAMLAKIGPTAEWENTLDLASIGQISMEIEESETALRAAVAEARSNGRSWGQIGLSLGVSKQAARERFGERVTR